MRDANFLEGRITYTMYIPSFVQFWGGHFQTFVELIWNEPRPIAIASDPRLTSSIHAMKEVERVREAWDPKLPY